MPSARIKDKTIMKRNYSTPKVASVEMLVNSFICDGSSYDRVPVTPEIKPSAGKEQQSQWGNVWGK